MVGLLTLISPRLRSRRHTQSPHRSHPRRHSPSPLHPTADATPDSKTDETSILKIRPLLVDDHLKEWTTGDAYDVTDRSFTIRRASSALSTNALPIRLRPPLGVWQPGPVIWPVVRSTSSQGPGCQIHRGAESPGRASFRRRARRIVKLRSSSRPPWEASPSYVQLGARRLVVQRQAEDGS